MGRIFGTDGARGVAGRDLTIRLAADIGRAAALVVGRNVKRKPRILIGKDTRISSDMLESAVAAGLCSVGADAVLVGVVPTPAVAYLVRRYGMDAGIMLSASHNPYEYNGIKIFGPQGFKLRDEEEAAIEEIILDGVTEIPSLSGGDLGRVERLENAHADYVAHLASTVPGGLSGMRIAVDCANGSASATAAELFAQLGAEAVILCDRPDGLNINEDCGSTHLERLSQFVKEHSLAGGVAFDGDADRCLAVDENGDPVDGDQLLAIFGTALREEGRLKGDCIVATVMSNLGFFTFARENGFATDTTRVGDRYVLESMVKNGYSLGGEQSGHIIFLEYMTTGDGQLSAIQLLSVMKKTGKPLSELKNQMKKFPQTMVNVLATPSMKAEWGSCEAVQAVIAGYEHTLGGRGRILVRPSGTEPLIRVMVEGEDLSAIREAAQAIANAIKENVK